MTNRRDTRPRWGPVEAGTALLVRLVLEDTWTCEAAAYRLLDRVRDPQVLGTIADRAGRADDEHPSWVTARATQTMHHALDEVPVAAAV